MRRLKPEMVFVFGLPHKILWDCDKLSLIFFLIELFLSFPKAWSLHCDWLCFKTLRWQEVFFDGRIVQNMAVNVFGLLFLMEFNCFLVIIVIFNISEVRWFVLFWIVPWLHFATCPNRVDHGSDTENTECHPEYDSPFGECWIWCHDTDKYGSSDSSQCTDSVCNS